MEIVSGHHWVAQRIPDDAYAVVANQLAIEDIDFDRPQDFLTSADIRQFVQRHRLNPDGGRFNSRHIFGTKTADDAHYNTSRVWYGHRCFTPSAFEEPTSMELPFIRQAEQKLASPKLKPSLDHTIKKPLMIRWELVVKLNVTNFGQLVYHEPRTHTFCNCDVTSPQP
ncbi:C69 family dipeptidase [Levilactobacillus brevis]|nr:C69 family dipeptidase [Levilactobacillus brevis]